MTRRSSFPECVKSPGTTFNTLLLCLNAPASANENNSSNQMFTINFARTYSSYHGSNGRRREFVDLRLTSRHPIFGNILLLFYWYIGIKTHSWSPLKSPNATTLPSPLKPIAPASINEFPLKRFGGKGQMAILGVIRHKVARK